LRLKAVLSIFFFVAGIDTTGKAKMFSRCLKNVMCRLSVSVSVAIILQNLILTKSCVSCTGNFRVIGKIKVVFLSYIVYKAIVVFDQLRTTEVLHLSLIHLIEAASILFV